MKYLLTCLMICLLFFCGCVTTKEMIIKPTVDTEVVEAEGQSPIIKDDITGAKNAALSDAQRAALGLVVGVFVTGETLVSKSVLLEENILGQTQGYIERWTILKESHDNEFYKVRIKAAVRKEDLAKKLNEMQWETKPSPIVAFWIDEYVEDTAVQTSAIGGQLSQHFINAGFRVSDDKPKDTSEDIEKQAGSAN